MSNGSEERKNASAYPEAWEEVMKELGADPETMFSGDCFAEDGLSEDAMWDICDFGFGGGDFGVPMQPPMHGFPSEDMSGNGLWNRMAGLQSQFDQLEELVARALAEDGVDEITE